MDAIQYTAPGRLHVTQLDTPRAGDGCVLVETAACGLCHTDIDVLHGRYGDGTFPLVPGHEYAGTVVEVGEGVSGLATGDRVVVDPNRSCGTCRACLRGRANLCAHLQAYGVTENGGFARYSRVGADNVHRIGDMPFDIAALAEPLGCVLNGVGMIETAGARDALVFGAGPIGLLMALALVDAGVPDVSVVDIDEGRLRNVESLGLTPIVSGSDRLTERARSLDIVVDATGAIGVVQGLVDLAANGGSVLLFGVCSPDSRVSFSPFELFRRQIRVAGSHSLNHNIPEALGVLERSGETMGRVISHRLPLKDIAPFLSGGGEPGSMKVQYVVG